MSLLPLFALLTTAHSATLTQSYDLDELSTRADTIVIGEVLTTRHEVVPGQGLYTVASIFVEETLRGAPAPVIEVRYPGGKLDDVELTVAGAPRLISGYDMLLFLDKGRVVGFGQGAFVIEDDKAWRASSDTVFVSPSADRDWAEDDSPDDDYVSFAMEDVRRAVR